jgi:hypothetical protein
MALILQVDDKGQVRPKIRCDSCGGIIDNYAKGVARLDAPSAKPGTILEPIFHCEGCEKSAQKAGSSGHSMPIVLNNIQLTPKALEDAGQRMKSTMAL